MTLRQITTWYQEIVREQQERHHQLAVVIAQGAGSAFGAVKPQDFRRFLASLLEPVADQEPASWGDVKKTFPGVVEEH